MPIQDTSQIKEKIIIVFKTRGPSLPVQIAKEIGLSTLFTSAFLSELLSEKRIKMSHMKVGSSSIYFIPGQEPMLEKFSQYLKSKEKEAFDLLKENKLLNDDEQHPAIRVALRAIKDFAIPFKKENKIYWRYFASNLEEISLRLNLNKEIGKEVKEAKSHDEKNELEKSVREKDVKKTEDNLINQPDILDKTKKKEEKSKQKRKTAKRKNADKMNEKFFNKVKEFLLGKSIEIISIEGVSKNEFILKIKKDNEEQLLIAYNKKKIDESDIIKAYKRALESDLKYMVLSFGDVPKKINGLLDAFKKLSDIEKLE